MLDGLRPYYYESVGAQTAAFHEFIGDLTAILMAFRNNAFRQHMLKESNGNLANDAAARRPCPAVRRGGEDDPYLRSGLNPFTMKSSPARSSRTSCPRC